MTTPDVREALRELVSLKDERFGPSFDPDAYDARSAKAWKRARTALSTADAVQPLSDEQIVAIGKDAFGIDPALDGNLMKFARNVLRAAKVAPPNAAAQAEQEIARLILERDEQARQNQLRRELVATGNAMVRELTARAEKAEQETAALRAELDLRRKSGSAVDRLHNLCEGIAADADGSEWSREEWERIDAENSELRKEIAALRADAERYRWLRLRLKVREERSLAGSCRDSIYIRVGQSFFDTPTRGSRGYVEASKFDTECAELDAAIDAALQRVNE